MTGVRFAKGAAAFLVLIAAGFFLGTYLDRRFTSDEAGYQATSNDRPTASACVGEDGAWKNWRSGRTCRCFRRNAPNSARASVLIESEPKL
jgi:hypothetical protein